MSSKADCLMHQGVENKFARGQGESKNFSLRVTKFFPCAPAPVTARVKGALGHAKHFLLHTSMRLAFCFAVCRSAMLAVKKGWEVGG